MVQLSHPYVTTGKIIALTRQTFVRKVMSLLFNMLSKLVIAFLPRSKCLLISLLVTITVILEPKKIKSIAISIVSPSICHGVMGADAMIFIFRMLCFKPAFSLSFTFIKRLFSSSLLSAIRVVSSAYLRLYWVAIPFSWGSSHPRDHTQISCITGGFFTVCSTRETLLLLYLSAILYQSPRMSLNLYQLIPLWRWKKIT